MRIPEYGATRWLTPNFRTAQHVIVGGIIIGCTVAYHLTGKWQREVVLIEQGQPSRGTTWHVAGLVGPLCNQPAMTNLIRPSPGSHCPAGLSPLNRCCRDTDQDLVKSLHARANKRAESRNLTQDKYSAHIVGPQ
ncbi:FAD-dependent oxidoreductase [Ruegeria sp. HKCCD7559]|uniref:FAD-dependent oxidoreductase n=1 Tax=Ruegeria sp. HKCCD7559 TaxID=2683005 RepID=UPI0035302484